MARIVADEHLVNLENGAEFAIECFRRNMRQVEIYLVFTAYTVAVNAHLKDLSRGNVARNKVAISRILFFEEVPPLVLGNRRRRSRVTFLPGNPNASTFTSG